MPVSSADREALQTVMLNYAAAVDERDRARYASCFCDDVEVIGFGTGVYHGLDSWVEYVFGALEKYSASQHLLGPMLIELDGNVADTRSDFQATHFLKGDEPGPLVLWATYKTRMRREGKQWRICRHELEARGSKHFQ